MDIWLTADTHFDHINIIQYEFRPFLDHKHMTECLIENWNEVVKPNDLVFHMGDVFFCNTERMYEISPRLHGRKIVMSGNHDSGISKLKFKKLGFDAYRYYFLEDYLLSHCPQNEVGLTIAKEQGLLKGNIHGHVHSKIEGLDQTLYQCVSVECTDYKPIHFEEVKARFKEAAHV